MLGDEPTWLVNLIVTISIVPILIGSLGEHVGTETLLTTVGLLFLFVGIYTVVGGQIVNPPRPIDSDAVGPTYENPLAVHETGEATTEDGQRESPEEDAD